MNVTPPLGLPRRARGPQKPPALPQGEPLATHDPPRTGPLSVEAPLQVQMPNPYSGALLSVTPTPRPLTERIVVEGTSAGSAKG